MTTVMWTDSPTGSMARLELALRISHAACVVRRAADVAPVRGTGLPVSGLGAAARLVGNERVGSRTRISNQPPISDFTVNNGITLGIPSSRRPLS